MACEVGPYYVLHITKQRNKNALLRLLPGLGECGQAPCRAPGSCPVPALRGWLGALLRLCLLEVVLVQG